MAKPDVHLFSVGEDINPETDFIRVRVVSLNADNATVELEVIKAEGFFASTEYPGKAFNVGMHLSMVARGENWWVIDTPHNLPWFELNADSAGVKSFCHYR